MLDKVFKAYDIRGVYPDPLSLEVAKHVGWGTGKYLRKQLNGTEIHDPMLEHVVVGRDMRKSSPQVAKALMEGITGSGMSVIDVGMVDTSFIYFAVNYLGCAGGVQTTASHNPPQYNGFKISGMKAKPIGEGTGLEEIKRLAATVELAKMKSEGKIETRDIWDAYVKHVTRFAEVKRNLKVVVDASNGMAGVFVPRIFGGIEGLEIIELNFETTGEFVHEPNPLVAENMAQTQKAVKKHQADLGVCFDGDADRCMVTDEKGRIVGCDLLGSLLAKHFLAKYPGSKVIYDLRSSKALKEVIEENGGTAVRTRVGHVFIKQVMRETEAIFGAELSGHMYYRQNFSTDSGAITFATVLSILSGQDEPLSELIKPFERYVQSGEINFMVEDKDGKIDELRMAYKGEAEMDDLDGITVDAMEKQGWWFNVRKSNTEPLLRLNLEAKDKETLVKRLEALKRRLGPVAKGH